VHQGIRKSELLYGDLDLTANPILRNDHATKKVVASIKRVKSDTINYSATFR